MRVCMFVFAPVCSYVFCMRMFVSVLLFVYLFVCVFVCWFVAFCLVPFSFGAYMLNSLSPVCVD